MHFAHMKKFYLKTISKNLSKKCLTLFAGIFVFANILPIFSIFFSYNSAFTETTYAEVTTTTTTSTESGGESIKDAKNVLDVINSTEGGDLKKKISEFATLLVAFFTPLITMVIKFAGALMSDAFIFGTKAEIGKFPIADLLYQLWDVIRTLVNYAFLLILLFVAVMNIMPMNQDKYNIKAILPSLIISIVTVNMTWFMTRVVFDVASVATHIVYALPESIANKNTGEDSLLTHQKCIVNEISPSDWDEKTQSAKAGVTPPKNPKNAKNAKKIYTHGDCHATHIKLNLEANFTDISIRSEQDELNDALNSMDSSEEEQHEKLADDIASGNLQAVNYGALTIYWADFDYSQFQTGTILPLMAFSMMQIQNLPRIANQSLKELSQTGADGNIHIPDNWTSLFINTLVALIIMIILLILFVTMTILLFGRVFILWANIITSPLMALTPILDKVGISIGGGGSEYLGSGPFLKNAFAPAIMGAPFVVGFIMISVGKQYPVPGIDTSSGTLVLDTALIDGVSTLHALFYYFMTIGVLWAGGVKAMDFATNPITGTFAKSITNRAEGFADLLQSIPIQFPFIPAGINKETGKMEFASLRNFTNDKLQGLRNTVESWDRDLGAKWRGTSSSPYTTERFLSNLNINPKNKKAKKMTEELKKINLNQNIFRDIVNKIQGGDSEHEAIRKWLKENHSAIPRNIRNNIKTAKDLAGMIYEAKNPGKHASSVAGKEAVDNAIANIQEAIENRTPTPPTPTPPTPTPNPPTPTPPAPTPPTPTPPAPTPPTPTPPTPTPPTPTPPTPTPNP